MKKVRWKCSSAVGAAFPGVAAAIGLLLVACVMQVGRLSFATDRSRLSD